MKLLFGQLTKRLMEAVARSGNMELHRVIDAQIEINRHLSRRIAKIEKLHEEVDTSDISTEDYI